MLVSFNNRLRLVLKAQGSNNQINQRMFHIPQQINRLLRLFNLSVWTNHNTTTTKIKQWKTAIKYYRM